MSRTRPAIVALLAIVLLATASIPTLAQEPPPRGEGGSCTYTLSASVLGVTFEGQTFDVTVTPSMEYGCSWTASSNVSWIQVDPSSGYGPGAIQITVDRYSTTTPCLTRQGQVTVGGTVLPIFQGGPVGASCTSQPSRGSSGCCAVVATKTAAGDLGALEAARRYRDEVLERTPRGRELVRLYYQHTGEVVRMMALDPWLTLRAARLLARHSGTLDEAVAGTANVTSSELDEIDVLLGDLELAAGPELAAALGAFRRELRTPGAQATCGIEVSDDGASSKVAPNAIAATDMAPYLGLAPGGDLAPAASLRVPDLLAIRARGADLAPTYDRHASEVQRLLIRNPLLALRLLSAYGAVAPVLRELVSTGGATMSEAARVNLDEALGALASAASPRLARDIALMRRDLRSPRLLAGLGVRAAARKPGPADAAPLAFVGPKDPSEAGPFVARGRNYGLAISGSELRLAISRPSGVGQGAEAVTVAFAGARNRSPLVADSPLSTRVTDLTGTDPRAWRRDAPSYGRVVARGIYPGVDAHYGGTQRQLRMDLVVAPHADTGAVRLLADGARVEADGGLSIRTPDGALAVPPPIAYQTLGSERRYVPARFRPTATGAVGIALGAYDRSQPLVLGAAVDLATSFGGAGDDGATDVALDAEGNIYLAGFANSAALPAAGGAQPTYGGGTGDAFVMKLDPTGTNVVYATYLGGRDQDFAESIVVDATGSAYVGGSTASPNFPTVRSLQPGRRGAYDGFVAVLDPSGSALTFSTLLGGSNLDTVSGVAVDSAGRVTACGATISDDFPTTVGAYGRQSRGRSDAFVARIDPTAAALVSSTRIGGRDFDAATDLVLDAAGNAVVVGATSSNDFPAPGGAQPLFNGAVEGFVTRVASDGRSLLSSTFVGGGDLDGCSGVAIDAAGAVYVTGATSSPNFPVVNALQPAYGGGALDAFVAKLSPDLGSVAYATYLGGSDDDRGYRIAVDGSGRAVVAGITASTDFPTVNPVQPQLSGETFDAFAASFDATGTRLVAATYLGGGGEDVSLGVGVDAAGAAVVVGQSTSADFPAGGAFAGANDVFVVRLAAPPSVPPPVVDALTALDKPGKPFRIKIAGGNLQPGVAVSIGGAPWAGVKRKSATQLLLTKGASLEALFPAGRPVEILVANPDGGVARATFTRD